MQMKNSEIKELLKRYQHHQCTAAEKALIETWYLRYNVQNPKSLSEDEYTADIIKIWNTLDATRSYKTIGLWKRIAVAALLVLSLSTSLYFFVLNKQGSSLYTKIKVPRYDAAPGGNKATLTLQDGTKINLTNVADGDIVNQAGLEIVKTTNGHLHYTVIADKFIHKEAYNTLETPIGGQYQLTLPDGSNVWLDAGSSLKYPIKFIGNERRVELTGQAYFEIAKVKNKSFKVISQRQQIEVFGTHFNVNAYTDEPETITTLLEGSVKVSLKDNSTSEMLIPGQQAILKTSGFTISNVDVQEVIAWKNGIFLFSNEEVKSVLNKIAKWYNVEVECDERLDGIKIGGNISRTKKLSEVLKVLQLTKDVQFKIEGRRIIAMP